MALVLDATVGGAASNTYELVADAQDYFDARLRVAGWDDADSQDVLLAMATRVLESMYSNSLKQLIPASGNVPAYYIIGRRWTGAPASPTQRLCWPRTGMLDANGNAIPSNVIPQELKDAESELAGQLGNADRTLDNDVIVQGVTSVKAGSVAVTFKDQIFAQVIPDAVLNLLVPSWLTDEVIEQANPAFIEVGSRGSTPWGEGNSGGCW